MAQEQSDFFGKQLWLLIKGCTDSPQSVEAVQRKGSNGQYLHGMKYDFGRMQNFIESAPNQTLFNTLENMRHLKCKEVIKQIKKFAKFAEDHGCKGVCIYYTGHGEKDTGNWCFSDGVVSLNQVLKTIVVSTWGKRGITMYSDCCYSGNWALKLQKHKKDASVLIKAASFPGNVAYDTSIGGLFSLYISKSDPHVFDELYWCSARVGNKGKPNGKYRIQFYRAKKCLQ